MSQFTKLYISVIIPLIALDSLWLGVITKNLYQKHLGFLFAEKFQFFPAILFYLLYAAGIVYFVLRPNLNQPLLKVFLIGAFLGLLAYAAYDLTNQATIKNWPLAITIIDLAWGAVVTGASAAIGLIIYKLIAS